MTDGISTDDLGDEIEFISDGEGLVVVGEPAAVDRFAASAGVPSRVLDLERVTRRSPRMRSRRQAR
jgi:hypothetical protein